MSEDRRIAAFHWAASEHWDAIRLVPDLFVLAEFCLPEVSASRTWPEICRNYKNHDGIFFAHGNIVGVSGWPRVAYVANLHNAHPVGSCQHQTRHCIKGLSTCSIRIPAGSILDQPRERDR
jgi:hypothetical protein